MSRRGVACLAVLTLAALGGCGGGSSSTAPPVAVDPPADPPSPPPSDPPPPPPELQAVIISAAPAALPVESSITLTAEALYDDGNRLPLETAIRWNTSDNGVLRVDSAGVATGIEEGTARILLMHDSGLDDSVEIEITPHPDSPTVVTQADWTDTAVRRVLDAFAYGSHASDTSIARWAAMPPDAAVAEIITFDAFNEKLALPDAVPLPPKLAELQAFLSSEDAENPLRPDRRRFFATLNTDVNGTTSSFSRRNLQRTWLLAVTSGGSNPVLHKTAFFFSNYQMSLRASVATPGIFRTYYDQFVDDLLTRTPMTELITNAAKSAAVSYRYGHRDNRFDNTTGEFSGNDDFAREYFQLFFRLLGETEDDDYHENVSIENNAMLLTGFAVDREEGAYGSTSHQDWLVAPVNFSDHVDATGVTRNNTRNHHADCLEILRREICGATAADKLDVLGPIVAEHPEVRANLPVYIASFFADDRIDEDEARIIRRAWREADDDLLTFLRSYASSTVFHSRQRTRSKSTFDRNLTLMNRVVTNSVEVYRGREQTDSLIAPLERQGGVVFEPSKAVFGSQTGPEAALNTAILKDAIEVALATDRVFGRLESSFGGESWLKDWRLLVPGDVSLDAASVADWLWQRLLADGLKNQNAAARAQLIALLATGSDFNLLAHEEFGHPLDRPYGAAEFTADPELDALVAALASERVDLDAPDEATRRTANERMNLAAGFLSVLPYAFAEENAP